MEFVALDPDATVRAANVKATLSAFQLRPSLGQRLIDNHDLQLDDLTPDTFMPVQRWLDALKELLEQVGPNIVQRVGTALSENADFPPQFDTLDKLFEHMNAIYNHNHRGDVGRYVTKRDDEGGWHIRCETPYPRQFERGLVEGTVRNPAYLGGGRPRLVEYEDAPTAGDWTCTMIVRPM